MTRAPIVTVVSNPGPIEAAWLARFADVVQIRRRIVGTISLRSLETKADERKPTVLLVHGRGHAASLWLPIMRELEEKFHFVAVDVPGFGHSAWRPPKTPSQADALSAFAAPIAELADELAAVAVVGHSLGGLIALEHALRRPAVLKALVLIGAMGLSPYISLQARLYLQAGPERLARLKELFGASAAATDGLSAELLAVRRELALAKGGARAKGAFDKLVPLRGDCVSREHALQSVSAKTLLLWGERDEAFPLPIAMKAKGLLPSAELCVLPAAHSPQIEMPGRVAVELSRFLSNTLG
jgi:pimeloyl-ACP methyl ester carboxylesterase